MVVNIARAAGKGDNAISSAIVVPSVDQLAFAARGEKPALFLAANLSSEKPVGADKILPMALDVLAEQFYRDYTGKVLSTMDRVAEDSQDILAELFFKAGFGKEVFRVNLDLAMVALFKEVFYIWIDGALDALYVRAGKSIDLRRAFGEEGQERFTGSGRFKTTDKLVVCNSDLSKKAWILDQLKGGLAQADVILTSIGRLSAEDAVLIMDFEPEKVSPSVAKIVESEPQGELVESDVLADTPEVTSEPESAVKQPQSSKPPVLTMGSVKKGISRIANSTLLTRLKTVVVGWSKDVGYMLSSLASAIFGGRGRRVARSATQQVDKAKIFKGVLGIIVVLVACGTLAYLANTKFIENRKAEEYESNYTELAGKVNAFEANVVDMTISDEQKLATVSALRSEIEALSSNKYAKADELDELRSKVQSGEDKVTRTFAITTFEVINDVALSFNGVNIVDFDIKGSAAYLLDAQGGRIFVMDLLTKTVSVYASSDELSSGVSIAWAKVSGKDRLFVYDGSSGIYEVESAGLITHIPGLSAIGSAVHEIATYQGNIYYLVPGERVVYKATSSSGRFSLAQTYNSSPFMADAVDISIDGAIWIINASGSVQKMTRGSSGVVITDVAVTGVPAPLGAECRIDTPLTSETAQKQYLYVLDPGGKRIVAINKAPSDGINYVSQIVYRGDSGWFNSLKELVISSDSKSAYLLDGSTLVKIDLSVLP